MSCQTKCVVDLITKAHLRTRRPVTVPGPSFSPDRKRQTHAYQPLTHSAGMSGNVSALWQTPELVTPLLYDRLVCIGNSTLNGHIFSPILTTHHSTESIRRPQVSWPI